MLFWIEPYFSIVQPRPFVELPICAAFRRASRFSVMMRPFAWIEPSRDMPDKTILGRSYGSDTLPFLKPPEPDPLHSTLTCSDHFSQGVQFGFRERFGHSI